jgi:predicted nuclease of predicted toxin-antitoxin system
VKLLPDMGISPSAAAFLRGMSHDALHLRDLGLDRLDDESIVDKARRDGRVLVTHDLDFGTLRASSEATMPSPGLFRLHNMRPDHVERYWPRILSEHAQALENRAVVTVTESRIRVRALPRQQEGRWRLRSIHIRIG